MGKDVLEKNEIRAMDHGNQPIDLRKAEHERMPVEYRPVELHHRANNTRDEKPSFLIVMEHPIFPTVMGQFSLAMLNDSLAKLGYEIVKK